MEKEKYTLDDLLNLTKEERKQKIEEGNITKAIFCNELMTNPKFKRIPSKGLIIKTIGTMNQEKFNNYILSILDKLS